ncbi:MAG: hypothetical protein Q8Q31_04650 [Nanoarchaeota archaeon]|nr:hypothetical protein [Nanoarchaeota archaeon]
MRNFREGNRGGGFNRNRSSGSSGRFGGRGRDRDSDRRSSEMHNVVCSKCGSRCQVPFKPTGSKPVFCSDCFRQNEGSNSSFRSRPSEGPSSSGISSDQLNQINAKLDRILLVLQDLEIDTGDDSEEDFEEESDEDPEKD